MALKKSDLVSSLLVIGDDLRRGMYASEYKCYMLFIKYISDKYEDASIKDMVAIQVEASGGA